MNAALLKRVLLGLATAESNLQKVIADTATEGEYGVARVASDAAESIRKIRQQLDVNDTQVLTDTISTAQRSVESDVPKPLKVSTNTAEVARSSKKMIYPRFEIRQDVLHRYGWSKREKQEYFHKVPRAVFARTVKVMEQLRSKSPGPIMAEVILKHMAEGDDSAPSYQVYVVLGLLRDGGCIQQLGREGYTIPLDVSDKAEKTWAELSAKAKG